MPNGKKKRAAKPYKMKTKGGGSISVGKKAVDSAKAKSGMFKSRGSFKGKMLSSGYKAHDGSFTRVSDPVSKKKAMSKMAYDKKLFKADSTMHANRTKRFASAKRK